MSRELKHLSNMTAELKDDILNFYAQYFSSMFRFDYMEIRLLLRLVISRCTPPFTPFQRLSTSRPLLHSLTNAINNTSTRPLTNAINITSTPPIPHKCYQHHVHPSTPLQIQHPCIGIYQCNSHQYNPFIAVDATCVRHF